MEMNKKSYKFPTYSGSLFLETPLIEFQLYQISYSRDLYGDPAGAVNLFSGIVLAYSLPRTHTHAHTVSWIM